MEHATCLDGTVSEGTRELRQGLDEGEQPDDGQHPQGPASKDMLIVVWWAAEWRDTVGMQWVWVWVWVWQCVCGSLGLQKGLAYPEHSRPHISGMEILGAISNPHRSHYECHHHQRLHSQQ